jgi:hypothetical protein
VTRLRRTELATHLVMAAAFAVVAVTYAARGEWFLAVWLGGLAAGWAVLWVTAIRSEQARLGFVVLHWLADHPGERFHTLGLARDLGLGNNAGRLYPVLAQLELDGLVTSGWDPPEPGRTYRRRWYASTTAEVGR